MLTKMSSVVTFRWYEPTNKISIQFLANSIEELEEAAIDAALDFRLASKEPKDDHNIWRAGNLELSMHSPDRKASKWYWPKIKQDQESLRLPSRSSNQTGLDKAPSDIEIIRSNIEDWWQTVQVEIKKIQQMLKKGIKN